MNDLKRRLGEDRKFFSYFHPALDDEPIIFVEVALTKGLGKSIQEIMKPAINKEKNYVQVGCFIYLTIVFIPFLPSGSFFADFNANLFWIN